jgi:tRNA A-37 threonylcarbamoyl transferase component Bud32
MRQIIDRHYKQQKKGSVRLWSNSLTLDLRLANILGSLHAPKDHNFEPLKQSLRRCVLRVHQFSKTRPTIIVKGFPLQKIESRLKYQRYGLAEVYNYMQAQKLGIPAPECYGYFEHRSWGTVKANGVLIEDLHGSQTLHDLANEKPGQRDQIMAKAIPIIQQLYEKGANHIDTTAHNIMESPDGQKLVVIDWQYASFTQPKNTQQLILQAVQFLRYTEMTPKTPEWTAWLTELFELCNPNMDWPKFSENVRILQSKKRANNKSRLSLSVDLPA